MSNKSLEEKKQKLFRKLSRQFPLALRIHKKFGLFETDESGKSWKNVSEHCFMEAARVEVFVEKLHFSESDKNNLILAAALHDFYKKFEIEAIKKEIESGGSGIKAYAEVSDKTINLLKENKIKEEIIKIISLVGGHHKVLFEIKKILDKKILTDAEIAVLVMHYIDDYTIGGEWVKPAEKTQNGTIINDIDRKMERNFNNPNYQKMNDEAIIFYKGHSFFEGKTTFEAMADISHLIEKRLSELIKERNKEIIESAELPEIIDREIKDKIS